MLPPQVPKFVLIKKVVDSKLFPPNADARGGISCFERTYSLGSDSWMDAAIAMSLISNEHIVHFITFFANHLGSLFTSIVSFFCKNII